MVTIRSIFGGGSGSSRRAAAPRRARASSSARTARSSPTHTSSPRAAAATAARPTRSSSSSRTATSSRPTCSASIPSPTSPCSRSKPDGLKMHPLELGNDRDLVVGQPVAAIGSPFGEQQSLSVGVVSATDRSVKSLTQFQIEGAIQTDASINPGNSGGPLLDARRAGRRHQPADRDPLGGKRRRRLRGPDLGGEALARAVARERQGQLRLHRRLQPGALSPARRAARPRHRFRRPDSGGRPRRACRRRRAEGRQRPDPLPGRCLHDRRRRDSLRRRPAGRQARRPRPPDRLPQSRATRSRSAILRDGQTEEVEVTLGTRPTSVSSG